MKTFWKIILSVMFLAIAVISLSLAIKNIQSTLQEKKRVAEIAYWISSFQEFNDALSAYYSSNVRSGTEIFPSNFGVLSEYGTKKRSRLLSSNDFKKFQDSISIDRRSFEDVVRLEDLGIPDRNIVIMHKNLNFTSSREVVVELNIDGSVVCR